MPAEVPEQAEDRTEQSRELRVDGVDARGHVALPVLAQCGELGIEPKPGAVRAERPWYVPSGRGVSARN